MPLAFPLFLLSCYFCDHSDLCLLVKIETWNGYVTGPNPHPSNQFKPERECPVQYIPSAINPPGGFGSKTPLASCRARFLGSPAPNLLAFARHEDRIGGTGLLVMRWVQGWFRAGLAKSNDVLGFRRVLLGTTIWGCKRKTTTNSVVPGPNPTSKNEPPV